MQDTKDISSWPDRLLSAIGLKRETIGRLAVAFAVGIIAGVIFTYLHLPLPWMLGPLTLALVLSAWGRPLERPQFLVFPIRSIIGVAIGASFTPELLGKVGGAIVSISMMVPYVILITLTGLVFLERVAKFDRATAFFCAAPGGIADMIFFAQDAGADIRKVTLVQSSRLIMIVFIVPFWLQFVAGLPLGGAVPKTLHLWDLPLADAFVIVAIAWAGWSIGARLGLFGASMIGPLLLSGAAHASGLTTVKVPVELIILAQLTIGLVVGGQFKGVTLREFTTILSWGMIFAAILVAMAGGWALLVAPLSGLDPTVLLLSYAPGGQNELIILGLVLGIDVAILALHHLVRVSMVILGAQVVMKSNKDWVAVPAPETDVKERAEDGGSNTVDTPDAPSKGR